MAYYDNISDAGIHFTSSVPEGLEEYRFPSQTSTTESASDADTYSTSSVHGELEAYPFLGHMSATENVSDANIYPTSSVPGELEAYPFPGQMSATEDVSFQADHTLTDPWSMAEQPSLLASPTTGFGATASYGTYHCHRSSRRLVSDTCLQSRWLPLRTPRTSTAMIGSYASILFGRPAANTPSFTTQTSWVKMFPSLERHRKYPLRS